MAVKNKTRYALLGVLSLMDASGYDIKKFCDKSISHFWNENFGHIYPVLTQLEHEGLIAGVKAGMNERRKVYSITKKGKEEFNEWLMQSVEYQPIRSEMLLKIAFGSYVPKGKTIQMIKEIQDRKKQQLLEYKDIENAYKCDNKVHEHDFYPYWLAPLRYGIVVTESVIKWCDETIENIEKHSIGLENIITIKGKRE